jgi:glycosyltransferase involved in cell wall biosynthesis
MTIDLSIVTNCHREGHILTPTIGSLSIAIDNAKKAGLEIEWIFVFDNGDDATRSTFDSCAPESAKICEVSMNDPGLARNAGVEASRGNYVALVDGDDLVSPNWFVAAYDYAVNYRSAEVICRPGLEIYFGETSLIRVAYDSDDPTFSHSSLFEETGWPITSLGRREIYLQHPFRRCELERGFAYEDSQWNCDTIAAGILHRLVPNTFFCYRIKDENTSWNVRVSNESCIMGSSSLFKLPYQRLD